MLSSFDEQSNSMGASSTMGVGVQVEKKKLRKRSKKQAHAAIIAQQMGTAPPNPPPTDRSHRQTIAPHPTDMRDTLDDVVLADNNRREKQQHKQPEQRRKNRSKGHHHKHNHHHQQQQHQHQHQHQQQQQQQQHQQQQRYDAAEGRTQLEDFQAERRPKPAGLTTGMPPLTERRKGSSQIRHRPEIRTAPIDFMSEKRNISSLAQHGSEISTAPIEFMSEKRNRSSLGQRRPEIRTAPVDYMSEKRNRSSAAAGTAPPQQGEMKLYLDKLRELVPDVPKQGKVPRLDLIQHAIDYICNLQDALDSHPRLKGLDPRVIAAPGNAINPIQLQRQLLLQQQQLHMQQMQQSFQPTPASHYNSPYIRRPLGVISNADGRPTLQAHRNSKLARLHATMMLNNNQPT